MATIANLAVSLTAKIGSFEKGFKKAQKRLKKFADSAMRTTKIVAAIGIGMAAIAAGALTSFVKKQFGVIDSISKLSRTLGLTTEELSSYQYAIQLAGGDQEGFNKAIVRMNRSIADGEAGLSTITREFDRVGLSVKELGGLSTDQRIKKIADSYLQIGDAAGRSSFLMNIFGRSGLAVGNLFEQGSKGISAAQMEAAELGLTFNNISGQQIEIANDAITKMQNLFQGAARVIAIQVAPFVTALTNRVIELSNQSGGLGVVIFNSMQNATRSIAQVSDWVQLLIAGWQSFRALVSGTTFVVLKFAQLAVNAFRPFARFFPQMENAFMTLDDLVVKFGDDAKSSAEIAATAFKAFTNKSGSKSLLLEFEEIKKKADQIAKISADKLSAARLGGGDVGGTTKTSDFKQIDLSKTVVGGIQSQVKRQEVQVEQLDETNSLLEQIKRGMTGGNVAVAA